MFHWICPECGREIPPAVTECPACEPQPEQAATSAAPVPEPVAVTVPAASPAPPKAVPAAPPVLSSAPDPDPPIDPLLVLAERIRAAQIAAERPVARPPDLLPQLSQLAASVGAAEAPTLELIPIPVTPRPASSARAESAQPLALLAPPQVQAAPAPVALAEPIPAPLPPPIPEQIRQEPVEPLVQSAAAALAETIPAPLPPPIPEQIRQEAVEPLVQAAAVALAEPIQAPLPPPIPELIRQEPAEPSLQAAPAQPLPAPMPPPLIPPEIREEPISPPPPALAESIQPPLPLPIAPRTARVEPVAEASAPPQPAPPSDRPPSGSWLKYAPLQDYSAAAVRAIQPAAPAPRILTPDSGPRITLPGPALPPQLNVRENLHVVTVLGGSRKKRLVPGWLVSFLVMATLLAAGIAVVLYLLPASHTTADAKSAAPEPVTTPAVEPSHPLVQYIEVTGIRFVMDLTKKSEIHYLVVNHSGSELSDMTVFVTLRTANAKAGQPPLCRFSFRSAGLGPFESKEMTSSIEKLPHPVALPDWHDLRAEVQIGQ
jgi:hypothetical protein